MTTGYAGFKNLADYLARRSHDKDISLASLSRELGFTHSYIHGLTSGSFTPSRTRADIIAKYFGDEPRVVRVLAGLETPPRKSTPAGDELIEIMSALPAAKKKQLVEYARFLRSQ